MGGFLAGANTYTPLNAAPPQNGQASGIAPGLQGAEPNFNPRQKCSQIYGSLFRSFWINITV